VATPDDFLLDQLELYPGLVGASLADQVRTSQRELMRTPKEDGKLWTDRSVSRAAADLGYTLSPTYVRQLRSGNRANPSIDVVNILALVFDVPVSVFYPEPDADEILRALDVLKAAGAEAVLTRGEGHLSPETLRLIAEAISQPIEPQARPKAPDPGEA